MVLQCKAIILSHHVGAHAYNACVACLVYTPSRNVGVGVHVVGADNRCVWRPVGKGLFLGDAARKHSQDVIKQ
jgi:hypothetical protein